MAETDMPEVTISAPKLPTTPGNPGAAPADPGGEQTVARPPQLSDMAGGDSNEYITALAGVDPQIAKVEQAIEHSPEERLAQQYDDEAARHWRRQADWDQKASDLQEQYANWQKQVGPAAAQYIENTPNRQAIYAANMHIAPLLAIVSAVGGKLTRASGMNMLAATSGAVQGLNAGNEQAYQDAQQKYKAGLDAFQTLVKTQTEYFNAMMKNYAGRADAEEKAAAAAERLSGNIRTEEQKKLATAIQAQRAQETTAYQLGRLQTMQDANEIRRQMYGLQFARGQGMGAQGLNNPISQYEPMQILGMLAANQVPLSGSRFTLAQEVEGIQNTTPNITLGELIQTMREKKLSMTEAQTAIRVATTRTVPTVQAYAALAGPDGIFTRLRASAAKVDFGSNQVQNEIRAWTSGHISRNANLQQYMTDLEDARAELSVVLSRGGRTSDVARGWAAEALPAVTSRQALERAINESSAVGQRVIQGDMRALNLIAKGGKLEDIFQQTSQPPKAGESNAVPAESPLAGQEITDPQTGTRFRKFPNGYMQNEKDGSMYAPDGKKGWRKLSGPPQVPMGQNYGGAGSSMAYAQEGGWGGYNYSGGGYDYAAGSGGYARGPSMPWLEASRFIRQYESGGRNVMNEPYLQGDPRSTASGPWQITDTNFHAYGRRMGINTGRWQHAMDAPEYIQQEIAQRMYEEQGFAPWAPYNPALARALGYG